MEGAIVGMDTGTGMEEISCTGSIGASSAGGSAGCVRLILGAGVVYCRRAYGRLMLASVIVV
jgi:hypothetical protein